MSQIMNPPPLEASEVPSTDEGGKMSTTITSKPTPLRQTVRFLWHFVEMVLAMELGMFVFGIVNGAILIPRGFLYLTGQIPEAHLLAMAFSMTVPMVAWMWFRRCGWARSAEMAGVMFVPAALLIGVCWLGLCPRTALLPVYHNLM